MARTINRLLNNIVLGLDRILNKALKTYYYGPYISSSRTTRKRHKQTSGGSAGDARTS